MKKFLLLSLGVITLAGCTAQSTDQISLEERMRNPLFAERYYDELTDRMVNMLQQEGDDLKKDPALQKTVDDLRQDALSKAQAETAKKHEGLFGEFVTVKELTEGPVLIINDMVYIGTTFATYPGPELHLYLTTAIDPRDVQFPDPSAVDLGLLQSPYGAHEYKLSAEAKKFVPRSVVLWDKKLKRIFGFAQID